MDKERLGACIWELRIPLLRLAGSILNHSQNAEDAVSQAVVNAYQRLDTLRDDGAVKPWLMRITVRCCYEQARRARREAPHEEPELLSRQPVWAQERDALYDVMSALPDAQRQVLLLYYYERFSTAQIAQTLGVPRATVSMRLSRGRRRLRALIEQEDMEGRDCIEACGIR